MPTKLTRIDGNDWERLDHIRRGLVMGDGENRTMADAMTVVLDRYWMTSEAIFQLAQEMVLSIEEQMQEAA